MSLSFAPVHDLVAALEAGEVRATVDPSDLNTPGAWVTVEAIQGVNLAGTLRLEAVIYLIVGDQDYMRAMDALAALYNATLAVVDPDGPVTPQGVILPDTSTPLPALRVPVFLYTDA